jgi:hypothetical protein
MRAESHLTQRRRMDGRKKRHRRKVVEEGKHKEGEEIKTG